MKLKYNVVSKTGKLARSIVETSGHIFRRFAGDGSMWPVIWQEKIHTGEFHCIFNSARCENLEAFFQAFPAATPSQVRDW